MAARIGCAILDANAVADVFGGTPSEAGAGLRRWINDGRGRLASGGRLHSELQTASSEFRRWAAVARGAGQLQLFESDELQAQVDHFESHPERHSNDLHILALAVVSGARLLYSNDRPLQRDFANPALINQPRGKVYSTLVNASFDQAKQQLLRTAPPCRHE